MKRTGYQGPKCARVNLFSRGLEMKVRMFLKMWLPVVILCLGMVDMGAAQIIFLDDFAGDDTHGRFVIEAEEYCRRTSGAAADWWEVKGADNTFIEGPGPGQVAPTAKSGARGRYMEALGRNIGYPPPVDGLYDGPVLDYKVRIETAGTYRLYMRWIGRDQASDSLYAFILKSDGTLLTGAGPHYFVYHQYRKDWIWDYRGVENTTDTAFKGSPHSAVWTISEPGDYTVRVAHRESGTALDAIVLQTENVPEPGQSLLLQSLSVPETTNLSTEERIIINALRDTLADRAELLHGIRAALETDRAMQKALGQILQNGDYGALDRRALLNVKRKIDSAIRYEQESEQALENGVRELVAALAALGFKPVPIRLVL
jgi:hypothetical protein